MPKLHILALLICAISAPLAGQNGGYADLVEKVQNAVVHIETTRVQRERSDSRSPFDFFSNPSPQRPRPQGSGSGFVITPDGYIVTNRHVVENAQTVSVNLVDGRTMSAEVVGIDDSLDIAVVKIEANGLAHFDIGESKKMRIGDVVLAFGYPLGLGFTVTTGIVSGIGRNLQLGSMDLATYIQSDADITFGNSGGPLVNYEGKVIGINTLIVSQGETYGFAIPSDLFMSSIEQIKEYGRVRRGALGIQVGNLSDEGKDYYGIAHGALVTSVYKGFPAEDAGIKPEDIILEVDGTKVDSGNEVVGIISAKSPGDSLRLRILSNGREVSRKVTLADRGEFNDGPNPRRQEEERALEETGLGFSLKPLTRGVRSAMGLDRSLGGMLIEDVDPGSLAEQRGIRGGSIVTHINDIAIESPEDLKTVLGKVSSGGAVQIKLVELRNTMRGFEETQRTVFLRKN